MMQLCASKARLRSSSSPFFSRCRNHGGRRATATSDRFLAVSSLCAPRCQNFFFLPRLCENSKVKLSRRTFVSNTLNKKRTALAGTAERRKERPFFILHSLQAPPRAQPETVISKT